MNYVITLYENGQPFITHLKRHSEDAANHFGRAHCKMVNSLKSEIETTYTVHKLPYTVLPELSEPESLIVELYPEEFNVTAALIGLTQDTLSLLYKM